MKTSRTTPLLLVPLVGILAFLALPGGRGGNATGIPANDAFLALVSGETGAAPLAPEARAAHLELLRARGPGALARFLGEAVRSDPSEEARAVALECLETCATGRELTDLIRLARPSEGEPSAALLAKLHAAVVRTLERDPRGFEALVPAFQQAGTEQRGLRRELLAAVQERGAPEGLEFLAWVATFETGAYDREVAEACIPLAPQAWTAGERAALERVSVLLDTAESDAVQVLTTALASARIEAGIPAWIELLGSDSRALRRRARQALEEVTGLALGEDQARWRSWHAAELAWAEGSAPAALAELASGDDARVIAALRALGARRAGRDTLALEIGGLLAHPSADVRRMACASLERLGSPLVLAELLAALEDEDDSVLEAAGSALRRLTGLDLPLQADAWSVPLARVRT